VEGEIDMSEFIRGFTETFLYEFLHWDELIKISGYTWGRYCCNGLLIILIPSIMIFLNYIIAKLYGKDEYRWDWSKV
jgi:hypothetical protein